MASNPPDTALSRLILAGLQTEALRIEVRERPRDATIVEREKARRLAERVGIRDLNVLPLRLVRETRRMNIRRHIQGGLRCFALLFRRAAAGVLVRMLHERALTERGQVALPHAALEREALV